MIDLERRRQGIGGSDVAGILGISPWATPLDVWRSKVMGETQSQTIQMEVGNALEPLIRQKAREVLDAPVTEGQLVIGREPWQLANVDGLVGTDGILEAKATMHGDAWGEEGTDQIPDHYLTQVAWYLMVTARSLAYVAVLIGGSDFRLYRVPRNQDLEAAILERCRAFWFDNVVANRPPPPMSTADCRKLWARHQPGKTILMSTDIERALADRAEAKARMKEVQDRIERAECVIQQAMGDAEAIVNDAGSQVLTWKTQKRAGYTVQPSESRVMRVTKWAPGVPAIEGTTP